MRLGREPPPGRMVEERAQRFVDVEPSQGLPEAEVRTVSEAQVPSLAAGRAAKNGSKRSASAKRAGSRFAA